MSAARDLGRVTRPWQLDVGCCDGLFSFAAESMGAAEVVGIDSHLSKPATEFLIPFFKSKVRMLQQNLYDLKARELGLFDVILFPGVLDHLRYPFWGLKVLRDMMKPGGELLIETAIWRGDPNNAMLFCPIERDELHVLQREGATRHVEVVEFRDHRG
jgi:2-polyprenyl-3-methyl-5-hydroxy-6-metoxy-1,4-benzoquinol methylase